MQYVVCILQIDLGFFLIKKSGLTFTRVVLLGIGVRLTGGSGPFEGRAEVFHNDGFTVNDGKVICRMLGFSTRYIFVSH